MARCPYVLILLFVLGSITLAQSVRKVSEPQLVVPELVMAIESVPGSADLVQLTVADASYSEAVLTMQIAAMAASFGSEPEGLEILSATAEGVPLRAVFSIPGLIDRSTGDMRLQPIVRAFMTGGASPIRAFSITFRGVTPAANTTLSSYKSQTADLQAFYDPASQTLEFRILALTDDPEKPVIPTRYQPAAFEPVSDEPEQGKTGLLVVLIILTGGSAGALVYFALLGRHG